MIKLEKYEYIFIRDWEKLVNNAKQKIIKVALIANAPGCFSVSADFVAESCNFSRFYSFISENGIIINDKGSRFSKFYSQIPQW